MQTAVGIIDVYEEILQGKRKIFPPHTWEDKRNGIVLLRYLLEEKLKWSDEDIKENFNKQIFHKYKLKGAFTLLWKDSTFAAINDVYPGKFKPWDFARSFNKWTKEWAREATKWMIEEKLKWSIEDIKDNISQSVFDKYGLQGMLQNTYNASPYLAITDLYGDVVKPWELNMTPQNTWTRGNAIEAVKWLIEEKLGYAEEDMKNLLTTADFHSFKLGGMLTSQFGSSTLDAIEAAYPGRFKPWEFKKLNMHPWNMDMAKDSIKWLVEEKLRLPKGYNLVDSKRSMFVDNGLDGMLQYLRRGHMEALEIVYPWLIIE